MNIVMLGPFGLHPKGTMRARALPAARALAARGHEVTVLMPPWHTPGESGRVWVEPDTGVTCRYVSLAGLGHPGIGHVEVAARMARGALALRPDVVHAFKPKAYSGLAAGLIRAASRLRPGPALVMDTDDWEGTGGWNDLEPYSRLQRAVFARQERWGMIHSQALTVASVHLQTLALAAGVPGDQVTYLPNALGALPPERPDRHVAPATLPALAPERGPALLLYTRFFEFDPLLPLEVLAQVRIHLPRARLVVVGRGLFDEDRRFVAGARAAGLADAVECRGWQDAEGLARAMADCDLALYPFDDTLVNRTKSPVKVLELLGAGMCVVASSVGELARVIEHGRSGWLVPAGDARAMAEAARRLLEDSACREALAGGARARVAGEYLWPRRAATLEDVYRATGSRR